MEFLKSNFINTHLQQSVVEVSADGTISNSIDGSGLDWSHKSGRFCIEVHWYGGVLSDISFGTDAEYEKPILHRTFYPVKRLSFSKDGREICFESEK